MVLDRIPLKGELMEFVTNTTVETSYFYIASFATVFFVIKLALFAITGGDTEVQADFDASTETDVAFDFFSIQSLLAFLMGFGWIGLACIRQWNLDMLLTALISVVFGLLMMFLSAYLMFCLKKLGKTVKKDFSKCIGMSAKAYTNFAPNSQGQIQIDFNGQLSIENAINSTDREIKAFSEVKIVKYEDNKLYIE